MLKDANKKLSEYSKAICNSGAENIKNQSTAYLDAAKDKASLPIVQGDPVYHGKKFKSYIDEGKNIFDNLNNNLYEFNKVASEIPKILNSSNSKKELSDVASNFNSYTKIIKKTNDCYRDAINSLTTVNKASNKGYDYLYSLTSENKGIAVTSVVALTLSGSLTIIILIMVVVCIYFIYSYNKEKDE